jgi:hypothetical protein
LLGAITSKPADVSDFDESPTTSAVQFASDLRACTAPPAVRGLPRRFHDGRGYDEWAENRSWVLGQAGPKIAEFVKSFDEFPHSQASMSPEVGEVSTLINSRAIGR